MHPQGVLPWVGIQALFHPGSPWSLWLVVFGCVCVCVCVCGGLGHQVAVEAPMTARGPIILTQEVWCLTIAPPFLFVLCWTVVAVASVFRLKLSSTHTCE